MSFIKYKEVLNTLASLKSDLIQKNNKIQEMNKEGLEKNASYVNIPLLNISKILHKAKPQFFKNIEAELSNVNIQVEKEKIKNKVSKLSRRMRDIVENI